MRRKVALAAILAAVLSPGIVAGAEPVAPEPDPQCEANLIEALTQLAGGAAITPANARFFASPIPVVLHIVSVSLYTILGAFHFVPRLRQRRNRWHRIAGRIVIPFGLVVALSGLWMTLFYPWPAGDGVILYGLRLLFGSAMLLSILLGVAAIRRRDFAQHGNWMLRGYAIGMGAGTQALTLMAG